MASSLYRTFAREGLAQGKTLEQIGAAWRRAHGGRKVNPYTPEGAKRKTRNDRLTYYLRKGYSFDEARRLAELKENPGGLSAYRHELNELSRRSGAGVRKQKKERPADYYSGRRMYRANRSGKNGKPSDAHLDVLRSVNRNPSVRIPGFVWVAGAAAGAAALGMALKANLTKPKGPMAPQQITAATAAATDASLYAGVQANPFPNRTTAGGGIYRP